SLCSNHPLGCPSSTGGRPGGLRRKHWWFQLELLRQFLQLFVVQLLLVEQQFLIQQLLVEFQLIQQLFFKHQLQLFERISDQSAFGDRDRFRRNHWRHI